MTQTLDALDRSGGFAKLQAARPSDGASAAKQSGTSTFGTFTITFGIAFAILYTAFERLNWPLFTYHPVSGVLDFWREPTGVGPPMFWYGWLVLSVLSASVVGLAATLVSAQWLRRTTLFCCVLAALWPAVLTALRAYAETTYNAEYLDSVWLAAIPAFAAAAAVTYLVPPRWAERLWANWLVIMPIGGLIVLAYSLQQYFVR